VATHESKRGRGFGRCIIEAIEEVARALGIPRLLLCSTREVSVASTWRHLGFQETSEQQLASWGIEDSDLVHMQNTLQVRARGCGCGRWVGGLGASAARHALLRLHSWRLIVS
jgi:N-acetylglutamate synthase-like GNAT family acetyltransferase